ncbi:MAG: three-Cys-motif partner protein TcmP [Afipia sp.]|uniref:three-Cys-motif partner protein TcmP n=1 Tax=Afipia massiliensis TaxID=211460 RepID=UPI00160ABC80|nr:three-Cys-motif partner protein TcmP [Afipia massiliensis]MCR6736149.1 three-Cys-motif partner protein TcmP [Afipia sp.]
MSKKPYLWVTGAVLEEHSRRKHKVIAEYVARYLAVRCQLPQQSRFRLAIVDGFAGGGRYKCGSPGSPLIFINELRVATEQFNIKRQAEGMSPLDIECLLILNDFDKETVELLRTNAAPLIAGIKESVPKLHLRIEYRNQKFDELYPEVKQLLERGGYHNVLFNLDQCGTGSVEINTISDIVASFTSVEIFYTFGIQTLLTFLHQTDRAALARQLAPFGVSPDDLSQLDGLMTKDAWLGAAERLVFESFRRCANYVSPFSIHNPDGWRYWLIHFANSVRARQEYNNILHQNSSAQAHFGRSGLHMLSYDPSEADSMLYVFDEAGRAEAKKQLHDDIPRLITNYGDALLVGDFYASIYNATPAHMLDINSAIIENPDLEVITEQGGGERRKANTIRTSDILRLKQQRSFFPIFFDDQSKKGKK